MKRHNGFTSSLWTSQSGSMLSVLQNNKEKQIRQTDLCDNEVEGISIDFKKTIFPN